MSQKNKTILPHDNKHMVITIQYRSDPMPGKAIVFKQIIKGSVVFNKLGSLFIKSKSYKVI